MLAPDSTAQAMRDCARCVSDERILFTNQPNAAKPFDAEIFSMKTNGTAITNLTNTPGEDIQPTWSPDYSRVAFVSSRSGVRALYVMNPDGTRVRQVFAPVPGFMPLSPRFSPDGTKLVFQGSASGVLDIYVVGVDGTGLTQVTNDSWVE